MQYAPTNQGAVHSTACEAQTTRSIGDMFCDLGFDALEVDVRLSPEGRLPSIDTAQ